MRRLDKGAFDMARTFNWLAAATALLLGVIATATPVRAAVSVATDRAE
jgi:hypothetical protein